MKVLDWGLIYMFQKTGSVVNFVQSLTVVEEEREKDLINGTGLIYIFQNNWMCS